VTARAIKRVIARQLGALMQDQGLTKSALAKRMQTSRTQLDRLLDPKNESVTLATLTRAAHAVGRRLRSGSSLQRADREMIYRPPTPPNPPPRTDAFRAGRS
jgi:transcriptional regulator with XRE-family HTH domain